MSYQGIPRQYRPQTFSAVVGQDAVVATLKNALRFRRVAQAYLFSGMRGTGKTTLARILAKAVNCEALTEECEPCNHCSSCQAIAGGHSLDVLEIDGASHRGVEDVRTINEAISYAPSVGKVKIYIIDEVHMLTKDAFNALLKTLEEPPSHAKFFLATTEPHKVLATITSRCQRFELHAVAPEVMKKRLAQISADFGKHCEEGVLDLIAHLSEGSLRDAESLLDRLLCLEAEPITLDMAWNTFGLVSHQMFFALDRAFAAGDLSFAFTCAENLFSSGKDPLYCLAMLLEHFRTLLQLHMGLKTPLLYPSDAQHYKSALQIYTQEHCLAIIDLLIAWQEKMAKLPFKKTLIELLLLELLRTKHHLSPARIAQRLVELEKKLTTHAPETPTPPPEPKEEAQPTAAPAVHPSRYESLMRFASVELEGVLKQ